MPRPGDPRRLLVIEPGPATTAKATAAGFRSWTLRGRAQERPDALAAAVRDAAHRHGIGRVLHLGGGPGRAAALTAADAAGLSMTSARSVHRLTEPAALRQLLAEDGRYGAAPGETTARAEHRPVYGVHTLTVSGAHHFLALTGRFDDIEVYPVPLGVRAQGQLRSAATAVLDLADLQFGLAHVRLVRSPDGPRVLSVQTGIEEHALDLLRAAAGFDPEVWLFRALAGEQVPRPAPHRAAAAIGVEPPVHQAVLSDVAALPHVRTLVPPRPSAGHAGRVVVAAPSPTGAEERIAVVRDLLAGRDRLPPHVRH